MDKYLFVVELDDRKLKGIFDRIEKAREEIYKCYDELREAGVIKISTDSGN